MATCFDMNVFKCMCMFFFFLRDNLKLNTCKKGEPMSPVRENVMTELTEAD